MKIERGFLLIEYIFSCFIVVFILLAIFGFQFVTFKTKILTEKRLFALNLAINSFQDINSNSSKLLNFKLKKSSFKIPDLNLDGLILQNRSFTLKKVCIETETFLKDKVKIELVSG